MKQISFRQLNLAFSIALLTIAVSCSKDDGGNGGDNLKKTVLNMPWIDSEPLTGSTGNVDFWKFSAPYTEDGKFNVCAVQNGNVADLGKQAYKRTDNNGTAATIDIDLKGKINEDTAYDLYLISGNYSIFSGNIWSTVPLERSDKPTFFYSRKNVSGPFSADAQICGVIESVYIINKSGKSIKFVQKPFIADEKWYYTKADVNLFDGSIRNAKTETEPKANTYEVYAHAEGQSFRISSSYIPNGKKIQNARLQAEIDGKIYTTENTISSDLDLQMGHAYGMVVIWDGEKLRFDGSGVMPDVHVYSDTSSSEAVVKEVRSDGTVVLDASTVEELPEEGEIIVSGITEAAPEGFLYHVEKVEQSNGEVMIRTSEASLNEVLPNAHFDVPFELEDDDSDDDVSKIPPYLRAPNYSSAHAKEIDYNCKKKFEIPKDPIRNPDVIYIDDETFKEYLKGIITIGLNMNGQFIWDSDGGIPDRVGVILNGDLTTKVEIEMGMKANFEEKAGEIKLKPIAFTIGGVPVVIIPAIQLRYGIKPKGKIYAKWTALDVKAMSFDTHLIWNKEANAYGENWDYGGDFRHALSDLTLKDFFGNVVRDMANFEIGLSGETKLTVYPELRFKLYNAEGLSLAIAPSPYVQLSGNMAFKWKAKDWTWDDVLIKDELTLSAGTDLSLEGKAEFKVPFTDKKIGGKIEKDIGMVDVPLVQGATLFTPFYNFLIYPDNNVKERDYVHISAYKGASILSLFVDYETDYGFCIALEKNTNGNTVEKEWKYISLKSKYTGSSYGLDAQFKVETDIPTASLQSNATYDVRPYVKIGDVILKRKGGKFKTGSDTPTGGVIDDVPGTKL